jgi:hypothetical protein
LTYAAAYTIIHLYIVLLHILLGEVIVFPVQRNSLPASKQILVVTVIVFDANIGVNHLKKQKQKFRNQKSKC